MKKGYWIVSADVTDAEKFKDYASETPAAIGEYGGVFLVLAGQAELVEGSARSRNVIIEFPSYQAAIECWQSETYQRVKELRAGAGELDIVITEGC